MWQNYQKRDQSVVVDLFTGQLKSTLDFECGRQSVTFDPYFCLSLPLPEPEHRYISITVVFHAPSRTPTNFSVAVPSERSKLLDLKKGLAELTGCVQERLLVALVGKGTILRFLHNWSGLGNIRTTDALFAFELPPSGIAKEAKSIAEVKVFDPEALEVGELLDVKDTDRRWLVAKVLRLHRPIPPPLADSDDSSEDSDPTRDDDLPTHPGSEDDHDDTAPLPPPPSPPPADSAESAANTNPVTPGGGEEGSGARVEPEPEGSSATATVTAAGNGDPAEQPPRPAVAAPSKPSAKPAVGNVNPKQLETPEDDSQTYIFVHYEGWPARWDEWLGVNKDRQRIADYKTLSVAQASRRGRVPVNRNEELDVAPGTPICP